MVDSRANANCYGALASPEQRAAENRGVEWVKWQGNGSCGGHACLFWCKAELRPLAVNQFCI